MEFHPRVYPSQLPILSERIILGSFPVWALAKSLNEDEKILLEKERLKVAQNLIPYFYGTPRNLFWAWYKKFIDDDVDYGSISSIEDSLKKYSIGITDVIFTCNRRGRSALDRDLTCRRYNHDFFVYPRKGNVLRILCTSKGVLNDMLLSNPFYKKHPRITLNVKESILFQNSFLQSVGGSSSVVNKGFFSNLSIDGAGQIQCLAIPSPGSPFRKLKNFGYASGNKKDFLFAFLSQAFQWFGRDC